MKSVAEKARKTVLAIEISRDELAFRIAACCVGARPVAGTGAKEALDQLRAIRPDMVDGFYAAADSAVLFMRECINAAGAVQ